MPNDPVTLATAQNAVPNFVDGELANKAITSDPEKWNSVLPSNVMEAISEQTAGLDDAKPMMHRMAVEGFLSSRYKIHPEEIHAKFELYRDDWFKNIQKSPDIPIDDTQAFDSIRNYVQREQGQDQMLSDAMTKMRASKSANSQFDFEDYWQGYGRKDASQSTSWFSDREEIYKRILKSDVEARDSAVTRLRPVIAAAQLRAIRVAKDPTDLWSKNELVDLLKGLTPEDKAIVMEETARGTRVNNPNDNLRLTVTRAIVAKLDDIVTYAKDPNAFNPIIGLGWVRDKALGAIAPGQLAEEKERFATSQHNRDARAEVDSMIEGKIAPATAHSYMGELGLRLATGLPELAAVAHPIGWVCEYAIQRQQLRREFMNAGVSEDDADRLSKITALPMTSLMVVGGRLLKGKASLAGLAARQQVVSSILNLGIKKTIAGAGKTFSLELGEQAVLMAAMNNLPKVVQNTASAIQPHLPGLFSGGVPSTEYGLAEQARDPLAWGMAVSFALIGSAAHEVKNRSELKAFIKKQGGLMEGLGFDKEKIRSILEADTPEEQQRMIGEHLSELKSEDIRASNLILAHEADLDAASTIKANEELTYLAENDRMRSIESEAAAQSKLAEDLRSSILENQMGGRIEEVILDKGTTPEQAQLLKLQTEGQRAQKETNRLLDTLRRTTIERSDDGIYTISDYQGKKIGTAHSAEIAADVASNHADRVEDSYLTTAAAVHYGEKPLRPLPPETRFTVMESQPNPIDPSQVIPGCVWVEFPIGNGQTFSTDPQVLRSMGYDVPQIPEGTKTSQLGLGYTEAEIRKNQPSTRNGWIAGSKWETMADRWAKDAGNKLASEFHAMGNLPAFAQLGSAYMVKSLAILERGAMRFSDWVGEFIQGMSASDLAAIKPHLKTLYRESMKLFEDAQNKPQVVPMRERLKQFQDTMDDRASVLAKKIRGVTYPVLSALAPETADKAVAHASAQLTSKWRVKARLHDVLGERVSDGEFSDRLGAVLVEDNLRGLKNALENRAQLASTPELAKELQDAADNVTTLVGGGDYFASEADYQTALKDPEIRAAIDRHKQTVQVDAENWHSYLDGQLAAPGLETGAFVNLKAITGEDARDLFMGGGSGQLGNQVAKKTRFGKERTGSADVYGIDYRELADRMVRGNWERFTLAQLYEQAAHDGIGIFGPDGMPTPQLAGKRAVAFDFKLGGPEQRLRFYVRADAAAEFRSALNLDVKAKAGALTKLAHAVTSVQVAVGADLAAHAANQLMVLVSTARGMSLATSLAKRIPGFDITNAMIETARYARKVVQDSPEIYGKMAQIAEVGAGRATRDHKWYDYSGKTLNVMDTAVRLVLNDLFDVGVKHWGFKDTASNRREFINQVGQYNERMMSEKQRFFRQIGFSPFIVAGRTMNQFAMRRLVFSPGVEAIDNTSAIKLRLFEVAATASSLAVPAMINYAVTGQIFPKDIPLGAVSLGHDDKKNPVFIDPLKWTGMRRAMRLTGMNAAATGLRNGESLRQIAPRGLGDIFAGAIHPWTGPAVNFATMATTGWTPYGLLHGRKDVKPVAGGAMAQVQENLSKAAFELNPTVAAILKGSEEDRTRGALTTPVKNIARYFGLNYGHADTPIAIAARLARNWKNANGKEGAPGIYPESRWKKVKASLWEGDDEHTKTAIEALWEDQKAEGKSPANLAKDFKDSMTRPFTDSRKDDAAFYASLNPEDRKTIIQAVQLRREMVSHFNRILMEVAKDKTKK